MNEIYFFKDEILAYLINLNKKFLDMEKEDLIKHDELKYLIDKLDEIELQFTSNHIYYGEKNTDINKVFKSINVSITIFDEIRIKLQNIKSDKSKKTLKEIILKIRDIMIKKVELEKELRK